MKNCSLVKKLGSFIGSGTLVASLFSSVNPQSVTALKSFLESKLFASLYNLVSDDDLKDFNTEKIFDSNFVLNLKAEDLKLLDMLQYFCNIHCDKKFQKDETEEKEIIFDFKKNFDTIIKKRPNLEKEDYIYLDKLDRFLSRQYNKNFQKNEFLAQIASKLRNIINVISGGFLDLKEKDLIFLVKLKKFCDKNCDEKYQKNELKRQRANVLREKIEVILNGNIEKKIDEFFKSDLFEDNVSYFTGSSIPEQNELILNVLRIKEEDCCNLFFDFSSSLFFHVFCSEHADDLKTTGYARFHLILSLWEVINFSKEILNDENYVNKLEKEDYTRYFYCFRVFSSDLIKFKIFTEEEVKEIFVTCCNKNTASPSLKLHKNSDVINQLIKESSFYDLDFKKRLVRLQSLRTMSDSYYKALDKIFKKFSSASIKSAFYEVLDSMIAEEFSKDLEIATNNKDSKGSSEEPIKLSKPFENEILKEGTKESVESEIDKAAEEVAESINKMLLDEISKENSENSIFKKPEEESFESTFNKYFKKICSGSNCATQ